MRLLVLFILMIPLSASGISDEVNAVRLDRRNSAGFIIAAARLNTDGSKRLSHVAAAYLRESYRIEIDSSPYFETLRRDAAAKQRYLSGVIKTAEAEAADFTLRGGFVEEIAKNAARIGRDKIADRVSTKMPPLGMLVGGALRVAPTDASVQKLLDSFYERRVPDINPDTQLVLNSWFLDIANTKTAPLGDEMRRAGSKALGLDLSGEQNLLPEVTDQRFKEGILKRLNVSDAKVEELVSLLRDQELTSGKIEKTIYGLIGDVTTTLAEDKELTKQIENNVKRGGNGVTKKLTREEFQRRRDEIAAYFGIAETLATIANDDESAEFFSKMGRLTSILYEASSSPDLSWANNPAVMTNHYLLAFQIVTSFLVKRDQPTFEDVALDYLRAIAEALASIASTLTSNFLVLNYKLDKYFYATLDAANRGELSTREVLTFTQEVLEEVRRTSSSMQLGFIALGRMNQSMYEDRCFPHLNGRALAVQDQATFVTCRKFGARWALGQFDGGAGAQLRPEVAALFKDEPVAKALVAELHADVAPTMSQAARSTWPSTWLSGTDWLVELGRMNNDYAVEFLVRDAPMANVPEVISVGREIDNFFQSVAVTTAGALREETFSRYVTEYENGVRTGMARDLLARMRLYLPRGYAPRLGLNRSTFVLDDRDVLFKDGYTAIEACSKEVEPRVGGFWWRDDKQNVMRGDYYGSMLARYQRHQLPKGLRFALSPSFVGAIDAKYVWLSRASGLDPRFRFCFSRLDIMDWGSEPAPPIGRVSQVVETVSFNVEVKVYVTLFDPRVLRDTPELELQTIRFLVDTREVVPLMDGWAMGPPPWHRFWNGWKENGSTVPGVRQAANIYVSNSASSCCTEAQNQAAALLEWALAWGREAALAEAAAADRVSDPARGARQKLAFLLSYGVDESNETAVIFKRWLVLGGGLPDTADWVLGAFETGASPQEIERAIGNQVRVARDFIVRLKDGQTLRPPPSRFATRIDDLEAIGKAPAK